MRLLDRPTIYDLDLRLDLKNLTLNGTLVVSYTNHESAPLPEIYFRLFPNYPGDGGQAVVESVQVNRRPATTRLEAQNTALRLDLPQPLEPNQTTQIDLNFRVTIPYSSTGHYSDFTMTGGVVTLPSVYPLIPSHDAAGWHIEVPPDYGDLVYADTSLYQVRVTAPATATLIASGSAVGTHDNGDNTRSWTFIAAPARDFDLNVSDQLIRSSVSAGPVVVNSYYLPGDSTDGQQAGRWAAAALQDFGKRIGPYPYREFDLVETPTTAGGIEYPGLVVISSNLYSNPREREFLEFAVVHETAHQWFYAMVGDDQVNTPWMDEALVQYCSLLYFEDIYGKETAARFRQNYFQAPYDAVRRQGRDKPAGLPVSAYATQDEYAQIVYGKGPLFFDALRKEMGDDLFFRWLKHYFESNKYKNVSPAVFLKTLNQSAGRDLGALYQQWIGK